MHGTELGGEQLSLDTITDIQDFFLKPCHHSEGPLHLRCDIQYLILQLVMRQLELGASPGRVASANARLKAAFFPYIRISDSLAYSSSPVSCSTNVGVRKMSVCLRFRPDKSV